MSIFNLVQYVSGGPSSDDVWAQRETTRTGKQYFHGRVNQCLSGDQCEGHACYCMNEAAGVRKCRLVGWGHIDGEQCEHFTANPHWKGSMIDTYIHLKSLGLAGEMEDEPTAPVAGEG